MMPYKSHFLTQTYPILSYPIQPRPTQTNANHPNTRTTCSPLNPLTPLLPYVSLQAPQILKFLTPPPPKKKEKPPLIHDSTAICKPNHPPNNKAHTNETYPYLSRYVAK